MIKYSNSWWGIKESGNDITTEILRIVNAADSFIIVCGYNFSFRTSALSRQFFNSLISRLSGGIQVLMIFPPYLSVKANPQPRIINHLMTNGVPIILNHHNHSKWLLTDKDLYYGSSNFTNASWNKKVEVVSIHEHMNLGRAWSKETIKDFKTFIDGEINDLTAAGRRMKTYRGLLTSTRSAWKSIKPLIKKFNPSIDKVIVTMENYDEIFSILNEQLVYWFDYYTPSDFEQMFKLSSEIALSVDELCEYAYANIYNEATTPDEEITNLKIIEGYNVLYEKTIKLIDDSVAALNVDSIYEEEEFYSQIGQVNKEKIFTIKKLLDQAINE